MTESKKDFIWVIVDRFSKCAHFLAVHTTCSTDKLVELYVSEMVKSHSMLKLIISDRGPRFTSKFWRSL